MMEAVMEEEQGEGSGNGLDLWINMLFGVSLIKMLVSFSQIFLLWGDF